MVMLEDAGLWALGEKLTSRPGSEVDSDAKAGLEVTTEEADLIVESE